MTFSDEQNDDRHHYDQRGNDVYDGRLATWSSVSTEWNSIRSDIYVVTTVEIRDSDFAARSGSEIRIKLDALGGAMAIALARLYECCAVGADADAWASLRRQKNNARKEIDELTRLIATAKAR